MATGIQIFDDFDIGKLATQRRAHLQRTTGTRSVILFDLNDTLIRSSAIKPLRKRGDWAGALDLLHQTSLPQGTAEFISELRLLRGVLIGVVTSSPRAYAEQLLAHHELDLPVLIAGDEVRKQKPDPESLLRALSMVQALPSECVYIGDHVYDVAAAKAAGICAIRVCWDEPLEKCDRSEACESWSEARRRLQFANAN